MKGMKGRGTNKFKDVVSFLERRVWECDFL